MKREKVNGSVPVPVIDFKKKSPPSRRILGPKSLNPIINSLESEAAQEIVNRKSNITKEPIQLPNLKFKTIDHDDDFNDRTDRLGRASERQLVPISSDDKLNPVNLASS